MQKVNNSKKVVADEQVTRFFIVGGLEAKNVEKWFPYILVAVAVLWFFARGAFGLGEEQIRAFFAQKPLIVDVRSPAEFARGHVDGAINIPVGEVSKRLDEFGAKDGAVGVYCKSGGRSGRAASELSASGYTNVVNLGGVDAIQAALKQDK